MHRTTLPSTRPRSSGPRRLGPARAALFLLLVGIWLTGLGSAPSPAAATAGEATTEGIDGVVLDEDQVPVAGVMADLFEAGPNGGRGAYLHSAASDGSGTYLLPADDGCYLVVLVAGDGQQFVGSDRYDRHRVCVEGGRSRRSLRSTLRRAVTSVSGMVTTTTGMPGGRATVDLYRKADGGDTYVTSTRTDDGGRFSLPLPSFGCFHLVTGPDGGSEFCVEETAAPVRLNVVVEGGDASFRSAELGGRIAFEDGGGAEGVPVELFALSGDGSRGVHLDSELTGLGGRFGFEVDAACYLVVVSAPTNSQFVDPDGHSIGAGAEERVCVGSGEVRADLDRTVGGDASTSTALTAIELEIARLTNELRTNPAGPLARRSELPECVDDEFYRIAIDPVTNRPNPVPALVVDEPVAVEVARQWAITMAETDAFEHRPTDSQRAAYRGLDVAIVAWGENIAWLAGYDPARTARTHFEGWRESDAGHYCAMMTGRFSHFGVGEYRSGDESWAVQNFYRAAE